MASRHPRGKGWSDLTGAGKFALVQGQVLTVVLVVVVAVLLADNGFALFAGIEIAFMLAVYAVIALKIRRDRRGD
jgi:hypothetical protein